MWSRGSYENEADTHAHVCAQRHISLSILINFRDCKHETTMTELNIALFNIYVLEWKFWLSSKSKIRLCEAKAFDLLVYPQRNGMELLILIFRLLF